MVPFSDSISSNFGTAVISLDLASVATCASTRRCSQPQALTMCSGDFPVARSNERPQHFPVDCHNTLKSLGKARHEPLECSAELFRIELPEQPAERVMAGHPVRQLEEAAQEWLLRAGEQRHVHRAL